MSNIIDMTARRKKQIAAERKQDALTDKAIDMIANAVKGLMAGKDSPEQAERKLLGLLVDGDGKKQDE